MTLHRYLARHYLRAFLGVFAVFLALTLLVDVVEQARRFGDEAGGFGEVLTLSFLRAPSSLYRILPLIVVLAALSHFLGLARHSEMVAVRASGRSALAALIAPLCVTVVIGVVGVVVLNPIVAATTKAYEERVGLMRGEASILALADDGLWLRQGSGTGQTVIRAARSNLDGTVLADVTFITFAADGAPLRRIEAGLARLEAGSWRLDDAKLWPLQPGRNAEAAAREHAVLTVPSTLTADEIRNSFGAPGSIPIWALPAFIDKLSSAGFSARRHLVFFHMELALPAFLVAMVLIGAAFTLRHQRGGRTGLYILAAVLLSFGAYFLRNFAQVLGESGDIPALLAAWAPPIAAMCFAMALILHLEDG